MKSESSKTAVETQASDAQAGELRWLRAQRLLVSLRLPLPETRLSKVSVLACTLAWC